MKVLLIQASSNLTVSYSRRWADKLVDRLKLKYPQAEIELLDLQKQVIPHLNADTIAASYTLPADRNEQLKNAIHASDVWVDQFLSADVIVLGMPMYNFSLPSVVKAYIDQIVRVGRTFKYTPTGPVGLVNATKEMYFVTSSGAIYSEGSLKSLDFVEPYLRSIFGFLGLSRFNFIRIEGTALGKASIDQMEMKAQDRLNELFPLSAVEKASEQEAETHS